MQILSKLEGFLRHAIFHSVYPKSGVSGFLFNSGSLDWAGCCRRSWRSLVWWRVADQAVVPRSPPAVGTDPGLPQSLDTEFLNKACIDRIEADHGMQFLRGLLPTRSPSVTSRSHGAAQYREMPLPARLAAGRKGSKCQSQLYDHIGWRYSTSNTNTAIYNRYNMQRCVFWSHIALTLAGREAEFRYLRYIDVWCRAPGETDGIA